MHNMYLAAILILSIHSRHTRSWLPTNKVYKLKSWNYPRYKKTQTHFIHEH